MNLLITHTDLDGISPIILLNLTGLEFEYKSIDIQDIPETFEELFKTDLSIYESIFITDLTIPEYIYEKINELGLKNIKVFDHHHTHLYANKEEYATVIVDYNNIPTCGTEIFYNYLLTNYPELNKPNIKQYVDMVREADTFTFTSEEPKKLTSLVRLIGKTDFIKSITKRLKKDKENFEFTAFEKRALKLELESIQRYLKKKETLLMNYNIKGYKCGVIFAERHKSELGNYISENHPELDLVILIDASSRISYRTVKDNIDVSEFASNFGGGGHKKASGSAITNINQEAFIKEYFKEIEKI